MKTRLIKIGNSRGIRIPKALLLQSRLPDDVELEVEQNQLVIRPSGRPREGWEEKFREMAARHDDRLIDGDLMNQNSWDATEWQW